MANRQTETVVTADDDLTGAHGTGAESVKITIGGKSATLDLLPASLDALMALVTAESPSDRSRLLRAALASGPAGNARSRRSGSRSGTARPADGAEKRVWLKARHPDLGERGKFTDAQNAEWDAHVASAKALGATAGAGRPASAPASTPASTPASASA